MLNTFTANYPELNSKISFQEFFRQNVGDVKYVKIFRDPNGRSTGHGIVAFGSEMLADKAVLEMDGWKFGDETLSANHCKIIT